MTDISDHASSASSTTCTRSHLQIDLSTVNSQLSSAFELRLSLLQEGADALRPVLGGLDDDGEVGLVAEGLLQGHLQPAPDGLLGVAHGERTALGDALC